jgi:hypothetical protein
MHRNHSAKGQEGSALILSLLIMILLFFMGAALLALSETERAIAKNDQWSEGAFQAAESAVQVAVDQLPMDPIGTQPPVPDTSLGDSYVFRSGGRDDTTPQPPEMVGELPATGYSVSEGTPYNPDGYVLRVYEVHGTGSGPKNAEREVEVQVEVGPVAN